MPRPPSNHKLNVPLILPDFHVFLIHPTPNGPTICHLLLAAASLYSSLFFPSFFSRLSVKGLQEKEGTSIPILLLKPFLQAYLQVLSGHSCSSLYATPGLRIRRAPEKTVYQISAIGSSLRQNVLSTPLIPPMSRQSPKNYALYLHNCAICMSRRSAYARLNVR